MSLTLSDQVGGLEIKLERTLDLCARMVATLKVNREKLCRDDPHARQILFELIDQWDGQLSSFDGATPGPGIDALGSSSEVNERRRSVRVFYL